MIAAALLILPLVFTIFTLLLPANNSRNIALIGSLLSFALSAFAWVQFSSGNLAQLSLDVPWISSLGIHFNIGIDGISLILVLLTGLLYPFIVAATLQTDIKSPKAFFALMLAMQLGLMGVFIAKDAFLFYVFYELTLIPVYFICAIWGGEKSIPITLKFFIYTLAGSLFMLIAIIYLYFKTPGNHTFDIQSFYHLGLSATEQTWIFWAFFLAFAIKIPIFPFHTWQPDTYTVAPAAGSMLLAGIMLKMGIYGLIRLVLPIVPQGVAAWGNGALILCIIGIVYASLIAWRQQDLKRLLAYSSIAHVGLIAAGVFAVNISGLQGAMIQMFNHGVNVVAMFFMIDLIERRYGTRWMDELGGVAGQMKKFGVIFMIVLLGSVGLPLTNGFIGEFLLLMGIYQHNAWMAAFAGLTLILGAAYMFRLYRHVFLGEVKDHKIIAVDTLTWENFILIPLCALILIIGVYPAILLNITEPAVQQLLQIFNAPNVITSGL
ncbi:MAG: NADH-quinone oxidoreductase subunit M [Chitinophagaceae bacterium]|nr:NADH-quinone oxidoreductase subunit M [Chitinophagaceae bacterium]